MNILLRADSIDNTLSQIKSAKQSSFNLESYWSTKKRCFVQKQSAGAVGNLSVTFSKCVKCFSFNNKKNYLQICARLNRPELKTKPDSLNFFRGYRESTVKRYERLLNMQMIFHRAV